MRAWESDHIQFARLLSEINAVGLKSKMIAQLAQRMDLEPIHVHELFARADEAFERVKRRYLLPANELRFPRRHST